MALGAFRLPSLWAPCLWGRRRGGWWVILLTAGWAVSADVRLITWNVQNGVGAAGTAAGAAVRETLDRLNPDVIAFQEVDAQHPAPGNGDHFADLRALLRARGFGTTRAHLATAGDGFQGLNFVAGDFGNSSQSVAVASRFPITRTVQIGRGVSGRREQTRYPLLVTIDLPGTEQDLTLVAVHLKQGDTQADEFRRGVEALRVREFLASEGISGTTGLLVVLGDMNEELNEPQTTSFTTAGVAGGHLFGDGSALPVGYVLGPEVPHPLPYSSFPRSGFAALGLSVLEATQTDGITERTYTFAGDARLDYVLAGSALHAAGVVRAEVYHSGRESVGDGLPKTALLPDPALSLAASDHLPVVADLFIETRPALTLTVPSAPQPLSFEPPTQPLVGRVSIPSPLAHPIAVTVSPFRECPLKPVAAIEIPAGETETTFPLVLAGSPFQSDRRITLVARAEGYHEALAILETHGTGVAGPLLISQYTETPSGSSPKAIEVMNVGEKDVHFAAEPLRVRSFASGSLSGSTEVLASFGRLPSGAVVVVGDTATGRHLSALGLISASDAAITSAETGTLFTSNGTPDGHVVFIKRGFSFNGDDALEVRLNGRRCDVFGTIGQDPGSAWSAQGVSTANQNLSRRPTAAASSPGWIHPGLAFETVGTTHGSALAGFGQAPIIDDPYRQWIASRGIAGDNAAMHADPDGNGLANGVEFVFGENGPTLSLAPHEPGVQRWHLDTIVRHHLGQVRWGIATTEDSDPWTTRWEQTASLAPRLDDRSRVLLTLPGSAARAGLARLFVHRW